MALGDNCMVSMAKLSMSDASIVTYVGGSWLAWSDFWLWFRYISWAISVNSTDSGGNSMVSKSFCWGTLMGDETEFECVGDETDSVEGDWASGLPLASLFFPAFLKWKLGFYQSISII